MAAQKNTTEERLGTVESDLKVLTQNVAALATDVRELAGSVKEMIRGRQFSWASVPNILWTVGLICGAALFVITSYFDGKISPIRESMATLDGRVERLLANQERNIENIGAVRSDQRGIYEKLAEIETQFKWAGQMINHYEYDNMREACRNHPSECAPVNVPWPQFSKQAER